MLASKAAATRATFLFEMATEHVKKLSPRPEKLRVAHVARDRFSNRNVLQPWELRLQKIASVELFATRVCLSPVMSQLEKSLEKGRGTISHM